MNIEQNINLYLELFINFCIQSRAFIKQRSQKNEKNEEPLALDSSCPFNYFSLLSIVQDAVGY